MSAQLVLALPVFKAERYLAETLASLNANGPHLRWWLQDGASTDRTVEIACSFARPLDCVVSAPDTGQTDALNRAMAQMGGDIIGFINGDDLLTPTAAEQVLELFARHPEVEVVYGEVDWIDAQSTLTGHHAGRLDSLAEALDIYDVWWRGRQWVQPEVFFRRSLFERVGGFEVRYQLAFDFDFWIRCFRAGAKAMRLPATLAKFRLHAEQKSTAAGKAADEIRAIVQRHLRTGARIPAALRWKIAAQIDYDIYQNGGPENEARTGLFAELLRHPQWLLARPVRERLQAACARPFAAARKRA